MGAAQSGHACQPNHFSLHTTQRILLVVDPDYEESERGQPPLEIPVNFQPCREITLMVIFTAMFLSIRFVLISTFI